MRENGVNAVGRRSKVFQHRHQLARGNFRRHLPSAAPGNAVAGQAPVVQHLSVRAVERAAGFQIHNFGAPVAGAGLAVVALAGARAGHLKRPAPRLRGFAGEGQAIKARQLRRMGGRAVALEVSRGSHTQAAVVGQAHADQRRIRHIAHAHGAVVAFTGQVDHAVAQVQRQGDLGVVLAKPRHQGRHMATAKTRWRRNAQVAAGLDATSRHTGLGAGHIGQQALAVFQKSAALVRERQPPRGAHHQLDAQALLQRIEPPAHDGGRHALGLGSRGQAASAGHRDKRFKLFEFAHGGRLSLVK